MKAFSSIDIGTNTIRMIMMEEDAVGSPKEVLSERSIVRLGEGINSEKRILPHRIDQAVRVIKNFLKISKQRGNFPVKAVATSAVREAENREEFVRRVQLETGLEIDVISWEEEARLTQEGVFWKIQTTGLRTLIFDIGGGSTEFILSNGSVVLDSYGTSLGVVRLTERFIKQHPIDPLEYRALKHYLRDELFRVKKKFSPLVPDQIIGTAGTVTTLAAIHHEVYPYDPKQIHNSILPIEAVRSIQDNLKVKSLEDRLDIKSLEKGREDLIIAGTAIVLETLEMFGMCELKVSEYGLREGVIIDQWELK